MTDTKRTPLLTFPLALLVYTGLALLFFLPAFMPGRHIFGTDYLAASYFFQDFIGDRFADGAIPKWVPYLYGGLPFFTNPASLFYPFRLIADLLLPVRLIFPTLYVLQFALAGAGMHLLVRELGARRWIALVSGLSFQFTGLIISYVYAGHDGRIIVSTMAPLLLFFLHRGVRTGSLGSFAGAAATTGFFLLSFQIQTAYYLLLAGLLWGIFCLVHLEVYRHPKRLAKRVALAFGAVAVGFAMASVNFLPFLGYVPESPRAGPEGRGYEYSVSWSMPPEEISGLAIPEVAGLLEQYDGRSPFKLHTEYVGAFALLMLALGAYYSRRDRYWWFFLALTLFALSISFGGYTPIYRLYYELLPATKRFRAPSISFFLVSTSLVAMAGITLERLARRRDGRPTGGSLVRDDVAPGTARDPRRVPTHDGDLGLAPWILGGAVAAALVLAVLIGGGAGTDRSAGAGAMRFFLFTLLTAAPLWLWLSGRLKTRWLALALAVVTVVDLWVIDRRFFETTEPPEVMFAADDVVQFLQQQPGHFRVWVLPMGRGSYRGQGDYLMLHDIDQAGGEHSTPLQDYLEYAGAGTASMVDWHNFLQDPVFMNAANVRYLISGTRVGTGPELREAYVSEFQGAAVYENTAALPRAWLVADAVVAEEPFGALDVLRQDSFDPRQAVALYEEPPRPLAGGTVDGEARIAAYQPDRVEVETRADRESLLVLADNHYAGWEARVDGDPAPILRANHTFRAVPVPAGEHRVVFDFRPTTLYVGLWIYVATLVLLGGYGLYLLVRRRRRRPG